MNAIDYQDLADDAVSGLHPMVPMPQSGKIQPRPTYGRRYILAKNGLFLEVKAPAGYFRLHLGDLEHNMPFGECDQQISFNFIVADDACRALIKDFMEHALNALPNEAAAWIIWNLDTKQMHLQMLEPTTASPSHITFVRPKLAHNECLAIDIHSHGTLPAFFSLTDEADDIGEVKLCMVIGNLDKEPTMAARLCVLDLKIDADFSFAEATK
jgi:PRTRC genetic system protein A